MKNDFGKLKQKIIIQVIAIAVITGVLGYFSTKFLIDGFLQAPFADWFISFCKNVFDIDYYAANNLYQKIFRDQKGTILSAGFFSLLLLVFYFSMSRFLRYFNEISKGIDKLAEESEQKIALSPELHFMEAKLNSVKDTLKYRKNAALESEQRKNDLVVYLAHDIKTPLTSVIGYLSLLEEATDMPIEQKAKYVKITLEKAIRLEYLINEFFEITRFNLQSIPLDKEEINLSFMLMQLADEFYPIVSPQEKEVEVYVDEEISIYGDPDKLARVFNNILKNAVAYSFNQSVIEITAKAEDSQTIIQIKNKGKTIPPQKLNTIFEKFYRLDGARSSNTGGAGLGLAIAKEIVKAHDGDIFAESAEEITTFTVTLPNKH